MVLALLALPAAADVTTGDVGGQPVYSDPGAGGAGAAFSPGTAVTGDGGGSFYSAPPIDHNTPETAEIPTVVGRIDPGRLEPIVAEASKIDHARVGGEPDVLMGPAVRDSGLWKTLTEVKLNPLVVVGGTLAVTALVVGAIVAISRQGARDRARRLAEAGPPVFFEGDVTFEADRDALSKQELQEDDGTPRPIDRDAQAPEAGPRRAESGLRY